MTSPLQNGSITFQAEPPERRQHTTTTLYFGGGCCSCCCCCLHTLGAIVGAAVAPTVGRRDPFPLFYYYVDDDNQVVPVRAQPVGLSGVSLFWLLLLASTVSSFLITTFTIDAGPGGPFNSENLLVTGILLLVFFPLLQLGCGVLTFFAIVLWPRPDKSYQLGQLGKLLLGVVVGSLLGIGMMVAFLIVVQGF